jgi:cell division inhibitor SepF
MSSMWRKAMHYLGLGPDDEYEDDFAYGYEAGEAEPGRGPVRPEPPVGARPEPVRPEGMRTRPMVAEPTMRPSVEGASVRTLPAGTGGPGYVPTAAGGTGSGGREAGVRASGSVRAVPAVPKSHVVVPTSFNDAQEVGDRFKANQPVLMDLTGLDRELSRRLIDFSSGLCYGLGGQMERLVDQSYLIIPAGLEVSAEERRRLSARNET